MMSRAKKSENNKVEKTIKIMRVDNSAKYLILETYGTWTKTVNIWIG